LTLNVRAWTSAGSEATANQQLAVEIDQLKAENAQLQQQIDRLQHDPKTIEREARKLGMGRENEKVFVPTQ
jgi:cell division protein FtsB